MGNGMLTFQDLQKVGESDKDRMAFVKSVINKHKGTELYKMACVAEEYDRQQNRTIMLFRKLLYTVTGEAVPDNYSADYKLCSNFFDRLITQLNQYLLGNGCTWGDQKTKEKLGKDFDTRLQQAGHEALMSGEAFGFWNLEHLEVFNLREFAPLYDEENGALSAGVRFWQIDSDKPMRATLYELDGYTDYQFENGEGVVLHEKRDYIIESTGAPVDEALSYQGKNYDGFPIIPLWANQHKQSELVGMRENIDAYDLIKSGFANTVDDASMIYWTISNAGGMDEVDLAHFVDSLRRVKAATVGKQGQAEAHTMDVPYASREAILDRLRNDIYEDFMALDTKTIAAGAVTATQIKAAYEPINSKADKFEYQVLDFIQGILRIAGIEDSPTFNRSMITNTNEEIQILLQSAQYLPEKYITKKIVALLGDSEALKEIEKMKDEENMDRLTPEEEEEEELPEPAGFIGKGEPMTAEELKSRNETIR